MYSDEQVAWACHEVSRVLQEINGEPVSPPWKQAPAEVRASKVEGVRLVRHQGATPRELHESWAAFWRARGWTWGPAYDPERKTHPCLTGRYEDLPPEQMVKDQVFHLVVTGLTVGVAYECCRGYQEHERDA